MAAGFGTDVHTIANGTRSGVADAEDTQFLCSGCRSLVDDQTYLAECDLGPAPEGSICWSCDVVADDDVETCDECGHATDDHDRRAEDRECAPCMRENGPCANPVWADGFDPTPYAGMICESGWTGDRCSFPLFHDGPHSN